MYQDSTFLAKTLEDVIKALGGEWVIRWQKTEMVMVKPEEVKFSD